MFGLNDDFFGEAKKADTKKKETATKKDSKAKSEKSGKDKKAYDCDVALPVIVSARNFSALIEGTGTKKLSQICDDLIAQGYVQMQMHGMQLAYVAEGNTAFVCENMTSTDPDAQVFESEDDTITVVDGMLQCELTPLSFPNMDAEEVAVKDLIDYWCSVNPYYKGCGLYLDKESNLAYPVFDTSITQNKKDVLCVKVEGQLIDVDAELDESKPLASAICASRNIVLGDVTAKIVCGDEDSDEGYFLTYSAIGKVKSYSKAGALNSSKANKKVEKRYTLPMDLYIVTWNTTYELCQEMFEKSKVTEKEIIDVMSRHERMFSDKSRQVDFLYNEQTNTLSCMFISGKKGYSSAEEVYDSPVHTGVVKFLRTMEEVDEARKKNMFIGVTENFLLKALPHGNFFGFFGKEKECCTVKRVEWERKLPKVPTAVLDGIIDYFREDLSREAAVRVLYNKTTGEFFPIIADGKRTKSYIEYDFSASEQLLCVPELIRVMEIHSHNTMHAFFSKTDDADEQYPGVFGVIGNLDMPKPTMLFRAGLDGVFKDVPVTELFD